MEALFEHFRHGKENIVTFAKWLLLSCVVGLFVGSVGTLFYFSVVWATQARTENPWLLYFLPLAGLAIVFCYRVCGVDNPKGTNLVIESIRSSETGLPLYMAPLIFVATVLTHLTGGSAGREGAALQLGGSMAYQLGRWVRLDEKDLKIITMCGMSAAFSALFGTPLTAAVFSMEMVSVGVMYYAALVPCVLSSVLASAVASFFQATPTAFLLSGVPDFGLFPCGQVILLGILCACVSILFCFGMHGTARLYKKYFKNSYIRAVAGGALVILLTLLIQSRDYLGAGGDVIAAAMNGNARPEAFVLKILFTAVTLGAGFKGGEIVPTFFVGATFGNVCGKLLGLSPSFGAGVGLAAVFCGVTNCPITSFILALELFGMDGAVYYLIAVAVSYLLSGYFGLYSEQKILYSKTKAEFIDRRTDKI